MCSLYAIFAIGASAFSEEGIQAQIPLLPQDEKTSNDYIAFAKQLIPAVYDEADIDSIRALAILVRHETPLYIQKLTLRRVLHLKTYVQELAHISTWEQVFKWLILLAFIETKRLSLVHLWSENSIVGFGGRCSLSNKRSRPVVAVQLWWMKDY
jgi:hypothetical protein